jgi:hypothetical protein
LTEHTILGAARANFADGALQAAGLKASHRVVDREADDPGTSILVGLLVTTTVVA